MPIGMMVHHSIIIQWALDPTSQSIYTMCVKWEFCPKIPRFFMKIRQTSALNFGTKKKVVNPWKKRLNFHAENHKSHFLANERSKFPMVFDTFLPLKKRLEFGWTFETLWSSRCVHWILCSSCCIIVKTSSSDCHLLRFQSFDTLTSCSPWAVRSILLALTCPYFCGRTVWKIGGRSPKNKSFLFNQTKKADRDNPIGILAV